MRWGEKGFVALFAILIVASLAYGVANIGWAMECAGKGGVYITGKSIWPVCLKAEVL